MDFKFKFNDELPTSTISSIDHAWQQIRSGDPAGRVGQHRMTVIENNTAILIEGLNADMADSLYRHIELLGYTNVEMNEVRSPSVKKG